MLYTASEHPVNTLVLEKKAEMYLSSYPQPKHIRGPSKLTGFNFLKPVKKKQVCISKTTSLTFFPNVV